MKLIQTIKLWLGWILYFLITQDARLRYSHGKSKGMHCFQRKDVSCLLPGSVTEFSYDPTRKPVREYLTRKEYFDYHLNTK
jgi:hypothetical protein